MAIRVSQATIDKIKKQGMTKSLAGAGTANAEMREGLRRMYGERRLSKAMGSSSTSSAPRYTSADAARAANKPAQYKSADAARAAATTSRSSSRPASKSSVNKKPSKVELGKTFNYATNAKIKYPKNYKPQSTTERVLLYSTFIPGAGLAGMGSKMAFKAALPSAKAAAKVVGRIGSQRGGAFPAAAVKAGTKAAAKTGTKSTSKKVTSKTINKNTALAQSARGKVDRNKTLGKVKSTKK